MSFLNFHHLRYFYEVARLGNLTRAAERISLTPSALSIQLKQLEQNLDATLFDRVGRRLVLTEAGRVVFEYAEKIFTSGRELMDTLRHHPSTGRQTLRVGAVSTLSRNFQLERLKPFVNQEGVELVLRSGTLRDLLPMLETHSVDVVLSNMEVPKDARHPWQCQLLDQQPVSLVAVPKTRRKKFRYPQDLREIPVLLPTLESHMRSQFDRQMSEAGIHPVIAAEVDDMAMLRLLARNSDYVTLVPPIVVQGELREGTLVELCRVPNLRESFYAITLPRQFPNPLVQQFLKHSALGKGVKNKER